MSIYLLTALMAVLTIIAYVSLKGDIIHPGFIVPFVFFFSCLCACYNVEKWNINLSTKTFNIILFGTIIYYVVSLFSYRFFCLDSQKEISHDLSYIDVNIAVIIVLTVFEAISTLLYLREEIRIVGGSFSLSTISSSLGQYKKMTHFSQESEGVGGIVVQLYQITSVVGLLFTYVQINNFLVIKKIQIRFLVQIVVYAVSIICSGNRLPLLRLVMFTMVVFFVLWHRKNGWEKAVKFKSILRVIIIMIVVLAGFVGLRTVVGKSGATVEKDPVYYITEYAGGSIQLLDLYVKEPTYKSDVFGFRTLYYINNFIGRLTHNDSLKYLYFYEFRYSNGINIGNVYTAYRAFYEDFGLLGMYFGIIIHSFFFSTFYALIRKRSSHFKIYRFDLPLIIFARMSHGYFFMSISFYSDFMSPNFIKLIMFLVVCIVLFKIKVKKNEFYIEFTPKEQEKMNSGL